MKNCKRYLLMISTSMLLLACCDGEENSCYDSHLTGPDCDQCKVAASDGTMNDADCNNYPTVNINNHIWMAKNMALREGVPCYANTRKDTNFVADYGCLYTWDVAMKVCPSGWHLPTIEDFLELLAYVSTNIGRYSSSTSLSLSANIFESEGNDDFGFGALPAGDYGKD